MFTEIMIKLITTILSFYLNHQHAPYEKLCVTEHFMLFYYSKFKKILYASSVSLIGSQKLH